MRHIAFGFERAHRRRTALEASYDKAGVGRDYAHLAMTSCRCVNIPARYCTVYLGDIVRRGPMDFAAWFNVVPGGHSYTFDTHHNMPGLAWVPIARGRDAWVVAISNNVGLTALTSVKA